MPMCRYYEGLMVNCPNIDFDGAARGTKFTVMQRKEKKNEVTATCCEMR